MSVFLILILGLGVYGFGTPNPGVFGHSGGEIGDGTLGTAGGLTILNGKVGIGTANPSSVFEVNGITSILKSSNKFPISSTAGYTTAYTDGFVVVKFWGQVAGTSNCVIEGWVSSPGTVESVRGYGFWGFPSLSPFTPYQHTGSFTLPVKKGDGWRVIKGAGTNCQNAANLNVESEWIPIGQ